MRTLLVLFVSLAVLGSSSTSSLMSSVSLSPLDKEQMKKALIKTLSTVDSVDVEELNAAISGLTLLDDKFFESNKNNVDGAKLCQRLKNLLDANDVSNVYYSVSAASKLTNCPIQINDQTIKMLQSTLSSHSSSASAMLHAGLALKALQKPLTEKQSTLMATLKSALTRDKKSVLSQAQLLLLASNAVSKSDNVEPFFKAVDDLVATADEIDNRVLQFDTGLIAMDIALNAIYTLNKEQKTFRGLTNQQVLKLTNYLIDRRGVQSTRGIYHLLSGLSVFDSTKKSSLHVPVVVQIDPNSSVVSKSSPNIVVKLNDVLGRPLTSKDIKVTINKITRESDGLVVDSNSVMKNKDNSYYYDLMASQKAPLGLYELRLKIESSDKSLIADANDVLRSIKVVEDLTIKSLKVGILESDESIGSGSKLKTLALNEKTKLKAQSRSRLALKFSLTHDVDQAFIRLYHPDTKSEIIYLTERAPTAEDEFKYKFDMELTENNFDGPDGNYELSLIIGDPLISKAVQWTLADLNVELGRDSKTSKGVLGKVESSALPEIKHKFREAEPRPPVSLSNLFTVLTLVPFVIMLLLWLRLDLSLNWGSLFSLSTLGFHFGLGAIFLLYYFFWLQFNMFETIKYLAMVGMVTFLCGNAMLVKIADKRK